MECSISCLHDLHDGVGQQCRVKLLYTTFWCALQQGCALEKWLIHYIVDCIVGEWMFQTQHEQMHVKYNGGYNPQEQSELFTLS